MEIDTNKNSLTILQNQHENMKKKYEKLQFELEKVKNNNRNQRKTYGAERSSSNFTKGFLRPGKTNFSNVVRGQSSNGSSINGSQKENTSTQRSMFPTSKYINDSLGNTHEFKELSTSKSSVPLGRNNLQNNTTLSQYESREDEDDE